MRAVLFAAILLFCVGCDQVAKQVATEQLGGSPALSLLGDTVRLELVQNGGAFLSLGASLPPAVRHAAFVLFVPLVLTIVCALAWRSGIASLTTLAGLALLAGGGLGNWVDRLFHDGLVTDFVSLGIGPLRTGVFNVADLCVMAGAVLFVLRPTGAKDKR